MNKEIVDGLLNENVHLLTSIGFIMMS